MRSASPRCTHPSTFAAVARPLPRIVPPLSAIFFDALYASASATTAPMIQHTKNDTIAQTNAPIARPEVWGRPPRAVPAGANGIGGGGAPSYCPHPDGAGGGPGGGGVAVIASHDTRAGPTRCGRLLERKTRLREQAVEPGRGRDRLRACRPRSCPGSISTTRS